MKLIYIGNDLKYETEAVMKLFLPAERFEFFYDPPQLPDGDRAVMEVSDDGKNTKLRVEISLDGKADLRTASLPSCGSVKEYETQLCRLIYLAMSDITGITSSWGILTGVRPVKQIRKLKDQGLTKEQAAKIICGEYLVSRNKFDAAWSTAETQYPILQETARRGIKSFGLYVSIPFCPSRCSYCSFISQSAQGAAIKKLIPPYIENLCEEIRYTGKIARDLGLCADSVYFGGGTPTTLSAAQLERVMDTVADSFDLSKIREYTIEAGRPDTITYDKLIAIKRGGGTRISINPQTLNDNVLENIGRSHTAKHFYDAFELAKKVGFDSINTDIIAGLPGDTPESFAKTVDALIALSPENITVHTLSVKRSSGINLSGNKGEVFLNPAAEMLDHANSRLTEAGYRPYYLYRQKNMVDNLENTGWSKPGHESVYNICIMEEVQTILAMGAVASTKLTDTNSGRLERVFNYKYPQDYNNNFELMLKRKDRIREFYAEEKSDN